MSTSDVMIHRGYEALVEYDADDEIFVGHLVGLDDIVAFHADHASDLKVAFHDAVDDYIATCERIGKAPQRSYSGTLTLRVTPEVHAKAALAAHLSGKSVDRWSEEILSAAAQAAMVD